jgi:CheY-like chemotaxis protein
VHRTTPVVILTADVDDRSLRSRVERLDGRLLTKPFMFDALRSEVRHALDQPRLH